MVENKTQLTGKSVGDFANSIEQDEQRSDFHVLLKIMEEVTGDKPKMWGETIVGFSDIRLKYDSGRELDWFKVGCSPRKGKLTLYVLDGSPKFDKLLAKLGKHKTGKSCLYIKKLADVDLDVLRQIIDFSQKQYS